MFDCSDPNTYFNSAIVSCEACPVNSSPNGDQTGCKCNAGFIIGDPVIGAC